MAWPKTHMSEGMSMQSNYAQALGIISRCGAKFEKKTYIVLHFESQTAEF